MISTKYIFWIFKIMTFLPSDIYASFLYRYYTGKKLNLKNPVEFNEKIQWYKVYYRPKILNQLADKYAVRDYVASKIGEKYLNKLLGVYESEKEIDFNSLPNEFVIKGAHASGYNLVVKDKHKINLKKIRKKCKKWLGRNYYYRKGQEWAYKNIKPRIVIEKILEEKGKKSLTDYKFYCFNGKPKFLEVHLDREENHKYAYYDLDYKKMPFKDRLLQDKWVVKDINPPSNFEEMKMLAEKLAGRLPFVRVDFYSINGKTIFGEMTFYPANGGIDFYPEKYNKIIGDYFKLPKISAGEKCITSY